MFMVQVTRHEAVQEVNSITGISQEIVGPLIQNQPPTLLYAMVGNVVPVLAIV